MSKHTNPLAVVLGECITRMLYKKPVIPDTPTTAMYLYGTPNESGNIGLRSGDTVTYYDGAVLPERPVVDSEKYPKAVLAWSGPISAGAIYDVDLYVFEEYSTRSGFLSNGDIVCSLLPVTDLWYQARTVDDKFYGLEFASWKEMTPDAPTEFEVSESVIKWATFTWNPHDSDDPVVTPYDPIPVTGVVEYIDGIPIYGIKE